MGLYKSIEGLAMPDAAEEDPLTGLPVLPEGYYWRIKAYKGDTYGIQDSGVRLTLRKTKGVFRNVTSKDVQFSWREYYTDPETNKEKYRTIKIKDIIDLNEWIVTAAVEILEKNEEVLKWEIEDAQRKLMTATVVGDYPPKKLGE